MKSDLSETNILALDPGIRGCGVAVFRSGRLAACAYVRNPAKKGDDFLEVSKMAVAVGDYLAAKCAPVPLAHAVLEWPRIYTASKSKGDNNDLLPLVAVDAAVVTLLNIGATKVYPHEWKGALTKEATLARVYDRLEGAEHVTLAAGMNDAGKTFAHNMVDAVGIGLHAVGRFVPKRVIAR